MGGRTGSVSGGGEATGGDRAPGRALQASRTACVDGGREQGRERADGILDGQCVQLLLLLLLSLHADEVIDTGRRPFTASSDVAGNHRDR
jgi:hypothetical protein